MINDKIYVAVVDDDESFARAISRRLRAAGFEVVLYPSAEAFLAPTPTARPDCLVLDVQLGGMSGLDLQQLLVARGAALPIIFVSAHDEPEIRDQTRRVGCVAYLRKPVRGEILIEAIRKAVPDGPTRS